MSLFDRDYMRNEQSAKNSFFSDGNNMVYLLIAVNALFFILNIRYPLVSMAFEPKAIIGSIFSHASFGHVFFNMFSLYIFGTLIARQVGFWKFFWLYIVSGVMGNLLFMLLFRGQYILLGASGAVGVGDNAFVKFDVFGVDFGNNQRNIIIHTECAGVINHDCA